MIGVTLRAFVLPLLWQVIALTHATTTLPAPLLLAGDLDAQPCPVVPIVQNFQANKYLGRWYEIERFFAPFQTGQCVTADYTLLTNCSLGVINSHQLPNGTQTSIKGVANSAGDPTKGSLTVSFPNGGSPSKDNYKILATDYTNYAVVYSCEVVHFDGQDIKFEYSWVLARLPRVNTVFLTRLHDWLARLGLETNRYMMTQQSHCQYAVV